MRLTIPTLLALLCVACGQTSRSNVAAVPTTIHDDAAGAATPSTRAIVISFDALNERRVIGSIAPERIPALRALFDSGTCAVSARPAFPSVTAAGHASLWTGAYGNVSGIAANTHLLLRGGYEWRRDAPS